MFAYTAVFLLLATMNTSIVNASLSENDEEVKNRYSFTEKELEKETDLYYFNARHYSPKIARFTSIDPAGGLGYDFYDLETGLIIRQDRIQKTPDGEVIQSTLLSDYREVDGILYPHQFTMSVGPQLLNGTVELIRLNSGMEESVFK